MTKATKRGLLCYDEQANRFCLQLTDRSYAMHCGESIGLRVGSHVMWGRLEMDRAGWYVIFSASGDGQEAAFTLRNTSYEAQIYW